MTRCSAGAQLGHAGIAYRKVVAAPPNAEARLIGAPGRAVARPGRRPRRRRVDDEGLRPCSIRRGRLVDRDLAADVVTLLDSGAEVRSPAGSFENGAARATWPCWCAPTARRSGSATPYEPPAFRR